MRRLGTLVAALALGAAILAGCTPTPTSTAPQLSTEMQSMVVAVAEAAAAGDSASALARLDELQQRVDAALAAGEVTPQRAAEIQAAIDLVRTDLQPAPEPSVAPAPEPTADPGVTEDQNDDNPGPGDNGKDDDGERGGGNDDGGKGKGKDD